MPNIHNRDFSGGWTPNADSANSPPNVLLRSDNLELDDKGILSLRQGIAVIADVEGGPLLNTSTGFRLASVGVDNEKRGDTEWTDPKAITRDDGTFATCNPGVSGSHFLIAEFAPLNLPDGVAITEVQFKVKAKVNSSPPAGTLTCQMRSFPANLLGNTTNLTVTTVLTDLTISTANLGYTPTEAEIESGVISLWMWIPDGSAGNIMSIDAVSISVLYQKGETSPEVIDSILSVELAGESAVLFAGGSQVYRANTDTGAADGLGIFTEGEGDTAMDSVDSHALITRGETHKKYDGETVRNWGIEAPVDAPNVAGVTLQSLIIANFTQASAEFIANEGAVAYVTGQDGIANSGTSLTPNAVTGRAEMTYTFAAPRNLEDFSGALGGQFDLFEFWFNNTDPLNFLSLQIGFGCDPGTDAFQSNGYFYQFGTGLLPIGLTQPEIAQARAEIAEKAQEPEVEEPFVPPPHKPLEPHDRPPREPHPKEAPGGDDR